MTNVSKLTNRELDALISEKVMGLEVVRGRLADDRDWFKGVGGNYSTDRNAAALVLQKIGELGLSLKFDTAIQDCIYRSGCTGSASANPAPPCIPQRKKNDQTIHFS